METKLDPIGQKETKVQKHGFETLAGMYPQTRPVFIENRKPRRMNMAFSDMNYAWLKTYPKTIGKNISSFVNGILIEYMSSPQAKDSEAIQPINIFQKYENVAIGERPLGCTQGRSGQKACRIMLRFSESVFLYLREESKRHGLSMTEFVNSIMDKKRQEIEKKEV